MICTYLNLIVPLTQNHSSRIDWNKYHIKSYGYLTENKTYHPETYHHYESWEQYTTNNYSYLEKTSNKNHSSIIDLTNDESIIDLCTSNTNVCKLYRTLLQSIYNSNTFIFNLFLIILFLCV